MSSLNLSANGPSITASYQKIVNAPPPSGGAASSPTYGQWAVFSVQAPLVSAFQADAGKESVLKVQTTGEGELLDLIEEFSDGRIQFAFVKVKDPNTALPKSVLIAWCGEGVPERTKGYFTSHLNAVSNVLRGYHVQVTARSDRDLTPELIVQKVQDASGSKYSGGGTVPASSGPPPPVASKPVLPTKSFGATTAFQSSSARSRAPQQSAAVDADGWGQDAPQVTRSQLEKVSSAYQPTKVDMATLQSQHVPSQYQAPQQAASNPDVVKGGYQPIGKVDLDAIRREAQGQGRAQDDRPTVVKGAYEPIGKVDIAAIRQQARAAPPAAQQPPPSATAAGDDERPKSLADRSAAFSNTGERLTSLPKPAVANRFGAQAGTFGGTKAPQPGGFEAKPMSAAAAPVGTASKTFADEGGKTPAQIWAEKKARERGSSNAADTQPSAGFGGPASPVQPQTSGGWSSGYTGKKWGVQIPSRTGGSAVSEQKTGEEPAREADEEPAMGNVGSIRDRFKDAAPMGATAPGAGAAPEPPPLDTASKPNAGGRGVPMPGLPTRPQPEEVPEEQHQDLPPPPARPIPQDEPEEDNEPMPQGSPIRVAMPVSRQAEPELEKAEPLPPRGLPSQSLQRAASHHEDPEPEYQRQDDEPARGAAQAAAAATFGAAGGAAAASALPSASAEEHGGREAIAQYDYEKAEDNELELQDGERITNIDMVDEDWWMGQNSRGESGLFPANYVELLPESGAGGAGAAAVPPPPAPRSPEPEPEPAAVPAGDEGATAVAQYDYEAGEDNELSFPDGATVTDIEFPDEDWWLGSYGGKRGLFPANYVELNR